MFRNAAAWRFNPCPDEKGTESFSCACTRKSHLRSSHSKYPSSRFYHFGEKCTRKFAKVRKMKSFNPCPDEKGIERAQKKATAPKDNRLVSILIPTKRGLKAHFPTFTPSHLLLVSILAPTKRGLKAHFPTFTPSHLLLVSTLVPTKRGLKAHFPTFTPSHLLLVSTLAPTKRGLKEHKKRRPPRRTIA